MALFLDRTIDDHADSLAHLLPGGKLFEAKFAEGSNLRHYLRALATELERYHTILQDIVTDTDINHTQNLINEWESAVGIPGTCFVNNTDDIASRRLHVLMVLRYLHGSTVEDYASLAALLGYTIHIRYVSPHACFPMQFPIYFFSDWRAAHFSMIIDLTTDSPSVGFPLTFPIKFISPNNGLLVRLFSRMKPANVKIFFNYVSS